MKAQIAAIEYALPARCVTNDDLERAHPDWSIHEVAKRTGVLTRFICEENETALDLAAVACERLFEGGAVARDEVGAIIKGQGWGEVDGLVDAVIEILS